MRPFTGITCIEIMLVKKSWEGRILVVILLAGLSLFAQAPVSPSPQSPVASPKPDLIVPAGEALQLELKTPLNSRTARKGDRAEFSTMNEVLAGDQVAIPRGATVHATVTDSQRAGTLRNPRLCWSLMKSFCRMEARAL